MTTQIASWFGPDEIELTPGVLDHAAKHAFSSGQCHALALAIHEHTGWEIVGLRWDDPYFNGTIPDHVLVRDPDGHLFDVNGYDVSAEWMSRDDWGHSYWDVRPIDPDELIYRFPVEAYLEPDLDVAMHFAPLVLEEAGVVVD